MEPALAADEITMTFRGQQGSLEALEGVSLQVGAGEFLCIVGPSGCGKSTLLRVLGGLVRPTSGEVYLGGELLTTPRRQIGFVFQKANLMPWRTVLRNVTLPLEIKGLEAERKLEKTQDNMRQVEGILGEVKRSYEALKTQAGKTESFRNLKEQTFNIGL